MMLGLDKAAIVEVRCLMTLVLEGEGWHRPDGCSLTVELIGVRLTAIVADGRTDLIQLELLKLLLVKEVDEVCQPEQVAVVITIMKWFAKKNLIKMLGLRLASAVTF